MVDPILSSIYSLRSATTELNQTSDRAAQIVQQVEEFLRQSSIGVSARVQFDGPSPTMQVLQVNSGQVALCGYLEYVRIGESYRLAVARYEGSRRVELKPWSDCSRGDKTASLPKLQELVIALGKAVEEQVTKARRATDSAAAVLDALKQSEVGKRNA